MKILVFGSRVWTTEEEREVLEATLDGYYHRWVKHWHAGNKEERFGVVEGAAPGADTMAGAWAKRLAKVAGSRVDHYPEPAEWNKYGNGAGPIRNQRMLDTHEIDLALGFVRNRLKQGSGSNDMAERCKASGVAVVVHEGWLGW